MTDADLTNDFNDLAPTQEKFEWVTPQLSLIEADESEGKPDP